MSEREEEGPPRPHSAGGLDDQSPRHRSEWHERLGKSAWERFENRRAYEWKIFFGVWTALGSAAGFSLGSEGGLSVWGSVLVSGVTLLIVCAVLGPWLRWLQQGNYRDSLTSYYWTSAVEWQMEDHLPRDLRPSPTKKIRWLRYQGPQAENAEISVHIPGWWECLTRPAVFGQVTITLALAVLFLAVIWGKTGSNPAKHVAIHDPTRRSVVIGSSRSVRLQELRKLEVLAADMDQNTVVELWTLRQGSNTSCEMRDADQDGTLDEWDFYEGGFPRLTVRDVNRDGNPDHWQVWNGKEVGTTMTAVDEDFDGKIDREDEGTFRTFY